MSATPESPAPIRSEELWMSAPEVQPLLHPSGDSKQEPISPIDLGPSPRSPGPIQLAPDDDETLQVPAGRRWPSINNLLEDVPAEHRSTLNDIGRGCVMVLTTPIAFAGVGLYAIGVIIEGIALVFKAVGAFGGSFLIKRRRASPVSSPRTAEAFV